VKAKLFYRWGGILAVLGLVCATSIRAGHGSGPVIVNSVRLPMLQYGVTNSVLTVSYPLWAADYTIQDSTNMVNWTTVTETLTTNGSAVFFTVPLTGPQLYFRLLHPQS
jgi:hypothetical protein